MLFLNCGMRLSELVGLNITDIDLDDRSMRLLGKGNKERIIHINNGASILQPALRLPQMRFSSQSERHASATGVWSR